MQIPDLFLAVLALDVFLRHAAVERPRPVKRQDGYQVFEAIGTDLDRHFTDTGAFKLEHARRIAVAQGPVGLFVVERKTLEIDLYPSRDFDQLQAIVNQGKRL